MCKRVNQSVLLQSLNDTRVCNDMLEPDDNFSVLNPPASTRGSSLYKLKGIQFAHGTAVNLKSSTDTSEESPDHWDMKEALLKFKIGYFSCPVVWETQFILHPRLRSGPGKSGLSRGVLALKTILDKFQVSNRENMFVYRDVYSNVFYLRYT